MVSFAEMANQGFSFGRVDGSSIAKMLVLLSDRSVGGYQNDNEHSWDIVDGHLVFKSRSGDITTRFTSEEIIDGKKVLTGPFLPSGPDPLHVLTALAILPTATGPHELVLARYNEDISWIANLPGNFKVTVYDKSGGSAPIPEATRARIERVIDRPNAGRESETFLEHIRRREYLCPDGFTVFLQGKPFDGAPELFQTLQAVDNWAPLQPLSWKPTGGIPDDVKEARREQVAQQPVPFAFAEPFSLRDLRPTLYLRGFHATLAENYRRDHYLPQDAVVVRHFLKLVGVDWIDLDVSEWGAFPWAAQFAVRTSQLAVFKDHVLANLIAYSKGHMAYGYFIEQSWLHLCGLPLSRDIDEIPNLNVLAPV